jgi:hypothetical protein
MEISPMPTWQTLDDWKAVHIQKRHRLPPSSKCSHTHVAFANKAMQKEIAERIRIEPVRWVANGSAIGYSAVSRHRANVQHFTLAVTPGPVGAEVATGRSDYLPGSFWFFDLRVPSAPTRT